MKLNLSSRDVALMAIFAALSAVVVEVVPGLPVIGLPSASIKFDAALAPIYGMIIGPYLGFMAGLVGGLVVADHPFSVLTSFATAISAFVAGSLVQSAHSSEERKTQGWMIASTVVGLLILGWYATWVGQQFPFYPVLHFTGLLIILAGRGQIAKAFEKGEESAKSWQPKPYVLLLGILVFVLAYIFSKLHLVQQEFFTYFSLPLYIVGGVAIVYGLLGSRVKEKFVFAIALASYCGIIADHMVGNLMFIQSADALWGWSSEYVLEQFRWAAPVSVVERLLFTTIATIVGVGLISSIRRAGLYWKKR
jgi:uncharacterized membrane protein